MKKFLLAGALLLSSATYAKSYFVKLNNQESLNALTESKNLGDKIFGLRAVETNIAPFAVWIGITLSIKTLWIFNILPIAFIKW